MSAFSRFDGASTLALLVAAFQIDLRELEQLLHIQKNKFSIRIYKKMFC